MVRSCHGGKLMVGNFMRTLSTINTKFLADEKKLDFYGTIGNDSRVHITVLNSILKLDDDTLVWGQFCQGLSKKNQMSNHKVCFLMLTPDMQVLTGHADWFESKTAGPELDMYNNIPRYRYNSYNGYSPIHYLKIARLDEQYLLDVDDYKSCLLKSEKAKTLISQGQHPDAISIYTRNYFEDPLSFKVLGFVDENGYPKIIPLIQCSLSKANRVVFVQEPNSDILSNIKDNEQVAIYTITLDRMYSVLVKGSLIWTKVNEDTVGIVEIDQVYNPMMPKAGYIYPKPKLERTQVFENVLYEYNV
jgi:hypothetical protein